MNRLASETSPYLRHHAHNPVDWYPWGKEALDRARREDKPILLSIGYSACHWCHVMARESFEDPATAEVMNRHFINIKVDREERPDLDRIYQIAHQMLAQRPGGWPLTVFLTPEDQRPFFSGTYFPDRPRHGMPAFRDLLERVAAYYREHREEIVRQNEALAEAFATLDPPPSQSEPTNEPILRARAMLEDEFDAEFGGFGAAPKFPHPAALEFLLRHWRAGAEDSDKPDLHALYMCTLTLRRMADGGLFDQLGGGFFRYSVDRYWMIPHFEKMLYDNAALLAVYAQAALATGDGFYADIAQQTADWMLREMRSPEGGFYSSLDADTGGREGGYYAWDREEIRRLLDPQEYRLFEQRYGLSHAPNFDDHWHLHVFESLETLQQDEPQAAGLLARARGKLLAARELRTRPERDEKILVGWNGLAIQALALASRALDRPDLEHAATSALDFARTHLWRDGRLFVGYKDGRAQLRAYLDDYAYLADAALELLQCRWRGEDLEFCIQLMEGLLQHFQDPVNGGFFFTADDHEPLMHRSRSFGDDATPAGNAVAARVLHRLGHLLGEPRYLEAAARTIKAAWAPLMRYPQGHASMLIALEEHLTPVETLIIRGPLEQARQWQLQLQRIYAPRRQIFVIPADATALPAALADKPAASDRTVAYLCRGPVCDAPVDTLEELLRVL